MEKRSMEVNLMGVWVIVLVASRGEVIDWCCQHL